MSKSTPYHEIHVYSLAGIVKRSQSIVALDIRITVSFGHQISDYIEKSTPGVKSSSYRVKQTYLWSSSFQGGSVIFEYVHK